MLSLEHIRPLLSQPALTQVTCLPHRHIGSGKVRELFDLGGELLMVASDRLSAFDVVLPDGIPGKGAILTQLSRFWFERTTDIVPNHLVANHDVRLAEVLHGQPALAARSMLVRKLKPLPIEAVVRGYLAGSGWKDYQATGQLVGHALPAGLRESEKLPKPLFTPSTKAAQGDHDEPITEAQAAVLLGGRFEEVRATAIALYNRGSELAAKAGIILADTKFEFGTDEAGKLYLIDEALTPDSSRYWPLDGYAPGRSQPSFDKQFTRDWLESQPWNKKAPAPRLPREIAEGTAQRYWTALERLTQAR